MQPDPHNPKKNQLVVSELDQTRAHDAVWDYLARDWKSFQDRSRQPYQGQNIQPPEAQAVPPEVLLEPPQRERDQLNEHHKEKHKIQYHARHDGAWKVEHGKESTLNVVLEVGYAESAANLAEDAKYWLGQGASLVMAVKLTRAKNDEQLERGAPGTPKFMPRLDMVLSLWDKTHLLAGEEPPEQYAFGNRVHRARMAPVTRAGQKVLNVPLSLMFGHLPRPTAQAHATALSPGSGVWNIDLYDLQQAILQGAIEDGRMRDGRLAQPMPRFV